MLDRAGHEITLDDDGMPTVIGYTQRIKTICECKSHDSQAKNAGGKFENYPCQSCDGRGFIYKNVTFYAPPTMIKDTINERITESKPEGEDKQASGKIPRGRRPKSTAPASGEQASESVL